MDGPGEFDLNTLRVDEEMFESGKKKLRIQNGQGLLNSLQILDFFLFMKSRPFFVLFVTYSLTARLPSFTKFKL